MRLMILVPFFLAFAAGVPTVFGCGCSPTHSLSISNDGTHINSTATSSVGASCGGPTATSLTLTSPTGRTGPSDGNDGVFYANNTTTSSSLTIGTDDGTYTAKSTHQFDSNTRGIYTFAQDSKQSVVNKYIQLVSTANSHSPLQRTNDETVFTVNVLASRSCGGSIQVGNGLSGLSGNLLGITNTPAMGTPETGTTAYETLTILGGNSNVYSFTVATTSNNTGHGTLTLSAAIDTYPAGCSLVGPGPGNQAYQSPTVN